MMGNRFPGGIRHGAKKAPPAAQEKGEKDDEGHNNSKLGRKGEHLSSGVVFSEHNTTHEKIQETSGLGNEL